MKKNERYELYIKAIKEQEKVEKMFSFINKDDLDIETIAMLVYKQCEKLYLSNNLEGNFESVYRNALIEIIKHEVKSIVLGSKSKLLSNSICNVMKIGKTYEEATEELLKLNKLLKTCGFNSSDNLEAYFVALSENNIVKSNVDFILNYCFKDKKYITNIGKSTIKKELLELVKVYCDMSSIKLEDDYDLYEIATYVSYEGESEVDIYKEYLKEVGKYKVLSKEETIRLFKEKEMGYPEAVETIIHHNLKLVINIAKNYIGLGVPFLDLIQEGNIILLRIIEKYDYKKGYSFSTYATKFLKNELKKVVNCQSSTVSVSNHMSTYKSKIAKIINDYKENGISPSIQDISDKSGYSTNLVLGVINHYQKIASLNETIDENQETELEDLVVSNINVEEEAINKTLSDNIHLALETLSDKEKTIITHRFGFGGEPKTGEEIGKIIGITRKGVSAAEKRAIKKLRIRGEKLLKDYYYG